VEGSGGCIPVVEGIVMRMWTRGGTKGVAVAHYVEVMLKEEICIVMRICLAEQVSLVELFRLYYCYQFLRVKKVSKTLL
jgi:hypothetical protein